MGNSTSDASITVLCKCQNEMRSTTPGDIYQRRMRCCGCSLSMAHSAVMFHCAKSNKYHKNPYDLCGDCAKKKALTVFCKHCRNIRIHKVRLNNKHNNLQCNQCNKIILFKRKSSQYIYECGVCNNCVICIHCAKNPEILHHKQQEYINTVNNLNYNNCNEQIMTTLHGYGMEGPYTPNRNMVWYCDNKTCQYTKHGLYRKYRIQNWRSSKFGKKFVLCDGCVRQYKKQNPAVIMQPHVPYVNVEINMNQNQMDISDNQQVVLHRSETEIIENQSEGAVDRTMTYM